MTRTARLNLTLPGRDLAQLRKAARLESETVSAIVRRAMARELGEIAAEQDGR